MKLRIRGNSVRIRVSQSELEQLSQTGVAEDRARFAPEAELVYRVTVQADGAMRAAFDGASVSVSVPRPMFERWNDPRQVSMRGEQPIGGGETLKILVEKDFACLEPRPGEDESDLFPNPAEQRS